MQNKYCIKCGIYKSANDFRTQPGRNNSNSYCRECEKREGSRRYYEQHPESKPKPIVYLSGELFKDVSGYDGLYKVSNFGRILSVGDGCNLIDKILKARVNKMGYLQLVIRKYHVEKTFLAHRLIALAFIPNPQNLPQVNHIDGVKTNNHISILEWVSSSGNKIHALKLGLINVPKGEKHWAAKLSDVQIAEIKQKYKWYVYTSTMLAKEYNTTRSNISQIINNQRRNYL